MPAVSLTDYTSAQAEITRRQKLADLLSKQSQEDIPIQSSGGIQAPIRWTALLAKGLSAYAGAHLDKTLSDKSDALRKQMLDAQTQAVSDFYGSPAGTPVATTAPVNHAPPIGNDDYAAMAQAPPGPSPQNIAAALGSDPTAAPPPQGPPPQAVAAALGGQPPPQAPMPQPMPAGPPAAPAAPPQAPPPVAAPVPNSIEARAAEAQRKMQVALRVQRQLGPAAAAPFLKAAQEQMAKIQDLQATAAEKASDRAQSVQRTVALINTSGAIPDAMKPAFLSGAEADPDLAKTIMSKMVTDAFTHQLVPAPPEALAGYPHGTVAQMDPKTRELKNIYNPVPNLMAIANEKLHAQEVSLSGARLGVERQRLAMDQEQKSRAVLDPSTVSQMAQQALAGDTSVFQNLGRGAQGAQNIVALRTEMYRQATLRGMPPAQIAAMNAKYFGQKAEARAAGTRVGATDVATAEVPGLAQEALAAHAAIPQTNLVPFNRAIQMVQAGTSSPELARAVTANQAVVNAYARSFGTGVTSDHARKEAGAILQNAWGTPAYAAALDQVQRNIKVERHGAKAALDAIGDNAPAPMPAPRGAPHQPYADPAKEARYQAWLKSHGG